VAATPAKSAGAFRTIGELSAETGVAQHILRYWETRFPQLRPLQRAGNRRYYRPEDVALVHRIHRLLNSEGYTVRGVQQLLKQSDVTAVPKPSTVAAPSPHPGLQRIRAMLADALGADQ
jgi:DNA-binding transcriptional MerR regulator